MQFPIFEYHAKLVTCILPLDKIQTVKNINDRQELVNEISSVIMQFKLIPVLFPGYRQHKIARHRQGYCKKHIANILQKENRKDSV